VEEEEQPILTVSISSLPNEHTLFRFASSANSHTCALFCNAAGNRAFRKLVKEHQDEYFRAKKKDKPSIGKDDSFIAGWKQILLKVTSLLT
jgi:hypothetical protein